MEITILALEMVAQIVMLILAFRLRGKIFFLFSAFAGWAIMLGLIQDGAQITYVSGGVQTTVFAGSFFILIPTLLMLLGFLGLINVMRRR